MTGRGGRRPGAGRKPRAGTTRSIPIQVRVTPVEFARWTKLAEEQLMLIPDWIRWLAEREGEL